jgi:hypothetical protein
MNMNTFASPLTEAQREEFREQERKRLKIWIEDRIWDLADDIGLGYNQLDKLSDAEVVAYARGQRNVLSALAEREEVDLHYDSCLAQIEGALGERFRRTNSPSGKLKRRLFDKLITQIRDKRIAMLDRYESLNYRGEYEVWRKRVWAIERAGVPAEEYQEFDRLRHELAAVWSLASHLMGSKHWLEKNWEARKKLEVKEVA